MFYRAHFLHKACQSPLAFRTLDSIWTTMLWGHFEHWNHQQEAQKCKRYGTKLAVERILVYSMKAKIRKQSTVLQDCMLSASNFSLLCSWPWKWSGVTNKFYMYVNLQIRNLLVMKIKTVVRNTLRSHGVNLLVLRSFKGKKTACIILRSKCVVKWREFFLKNNSRKFEGKGLENWRHPKDKRNAYLSPNQITGTEIKLILIHSFST